MSIILGKRSHATPSRLDSCNLCRAQTYARTGGDARELTKIPTLPTWLDRTEVVTPQRTK